MYKLTTYFTKNDKELYIVPHLDKPSPNEPFIIPAESSLLTLNIDNIKVDFSVSEFMLMYESFTRSEKYLSLKQCFVIETADDVSTIFIDSNTDFTVDTAVLSTMIEEAAEHIRLFRHTFSDYIKLGYFNMWSSPASIVPNEMANATSDMEATLETETNFSETNTNNASNEASLSDAEVAEMPTQTEPDVNTVFVKQVLALKNGFKLICHDKDTEGDWILYLRSDVAGKIDCWKEVLNSINANAKKGNLTTINCTTKTCQSNGKDFMEILSIIKD